MKKKKIIITGGAGFLGYNLIKKYHADNSITVYSRDEAKHYYLAKQFPDVRFIIGDVRNRDLLIRSCRDHNIGIFAASMKQIDTCSENIDEALQTIVHGAFNSKVAAVENNFQSACFVSTDKSRAATTIYGAMKYVAGEAFILNNDDYTTRFSTVIYGNVTNSTGSLIPLIWNAISHNLTLDLYHEDMTRFMIDIDDAVELVDISLKMSNVNVIPKIEGFLIKDIFEIYADKFGLQYRIGKPRINEKIHEVMASAEEIPRMKFLSDFNCYIMHPYITYDELSWPNGEYSSNGTILDKEQLLEHLTKKDFYK